MKNVYYEVEDGDLDKILERYNRDRKSLDEDVQSLREWFKNQPHLPEVPNEKMILGFLLLNKFRIERTKEKIDMYYTVRSRIPELYERINPKLPEMKLVMDLIYWITFPKLTQDLYRVSLFKLRTKETSKIDIYNFFAHTYNLCEVRIQEDLVVGEILIYDMTGTNVSLITKLTPTVIAKVAVVFEKVYSSPLKAIHFINSPPIINKLVAILKTVLKPKLAQRINVHEDENSLMEHIPKEILSKDYGGNEKSLEELNELTKVKLEEYQERFDLLDKLRVNEDLRPAKLEDDDVLGFHGNFKKLSVD